MIRKFTVYSLRFTGSTRRFFCSRLSTVNCQLHVRGFTLIETMVAISLLTIAIVAPMSLTTQSLSTSYYARDQITAFHLAQEAIESVRHVRDGNVLNNAIGVQEDLLAGIPDTAGNPFTVSTLDDDVALCLQSGCPPLQTDGELYGYRPGCAMPTSNCGNSEGWENTRFTRTARAVFVKNPDGTDNLDEVHITVMVSWQTGSYQLRSFTISENLFRWVNDGSGAQ